MSLGIITVAAVLLGCGVAAESREPGDERPGGDGGWGPGSAYGRMFDPSTVETLRGEVAALELINPRKGMTCGVCLTLRTEQGALAVHLGPEWHVRRQEVGLGVHDHIEVTGSRVAFKGEEIIVAVQVRKGDATLVLRDDRGVPAWSGWRRR